MLMLLDFRVRQRDFLLEISRAITAQLDLSEVLKRVLNASVAMLGGQVGLITLRDVNGGYRVRATLGAGDQLHDLEARFESGPDRREPPGQAARGTATLELGDVHVGPLPVHARQLQKALSRICRRRPCEVRTDGTIDGKYQLDIIAGTAGGNLHLLWSTPCVALHD